MKAEKTNIDGLIIVTPDIFHDRRGYFFESFNARSFYDLTGLNIDFVQDNESLSGISVLRGLHYQLPPYEQAKLIRVVKGKVIDIAVDIREGSETYGQYFSIELSEENKKQLFIPPGFAHGFLSLSNDTILSYKCSNYYDQASEAGIRYDDPILRIDWKVDKNKLALSEKDTDLPSFGDHKRYFIR